MPQTRDAVWQPTKSDKSERLLQITCALVFSNRGLTKAQLFRSIPAYINAQHQGTSEDSLNRMFERDKSDLRATGIQILASDSNSDFDEVLYRIADDTFIWPQKFELNANQLQILTLASQVWSQASLQSDARQALVRLRALGIEASKSSLIGFSPRIRTHEPSFLPLTAAIESNVEVSFDYRKPDGQTEKRLVQPWSLHNVDGQWLLQSFDVKRNAVRNFLLKRIVSKVQTILHGEVPSTFSAPNQKATEEALASLRQHVEGQICELKVVKDSSAWFHFQLDDLPNNPDGKVKFHYMDLGLLAEEVREFVSDVEIIRPVELAESIRAGFEKILADHV